MAALFKGLVQSSSIEYLYLHNNDFGADGVQSMVPFLENSPNLLTINLGYNNIGREGCVTLSNLLQLNGSLSALNSLQLSSTGIGDDGAEVLATSLKYNTKLKELELEDNNIGWRGASALLKLLSDTTSIESMCTSNHTLATLKLQSFKDKSTTLKDHITWIDYACLVNRRFPASSGRIKVREVQTDGPSRKILHGLIYNEEPPINLFAVIEPNLFPDILSLIGEKHGQSELYGALIQMAPDLMSFIDRKAKIKETMASNSAQINDLVSALSAKISALSEKNNGLSKRLALIDLGDSRQLAGEEGNGSKNIVGDRKRQRSASF